MWWLIGRLGYGYWCRLKMDIGAGERCKVLPVYAPTDETTWANMEIKCTFCMADVSDDWFGINFKLGFLSTFRGVDCSHKSPCLPAYTATCTNDHHCSVDSQTTHRSCRGEEKVLDRPLHGDRIVVRDSCFSLEPWPPQVPLWMVHISFIDRC